jgi:ferritin
MKDRKLLDIKVVETLNYRIQQEEDSSRLYEQASLWFDNYGYLNLSELYKKYACEEKAHADWSKSYLLDYGYTPELRQLKLQDTEFESCLQIFEITLEHELEITRQCEELASLALKEGNHVLYALASKYCKEQQEEIGKAVQLIDIHNLTADLLVLDGYVKENLLD